MTLGTITPVLVRRVETGNRGGQFWRRRVPEVATAFADACTTLSGAGARIVDVPLINTKGGFTPIEAYAWHRPLLSRRGDDYDQRVRTSIERGGGMTAVEYIDLCAARADLSARIALRTADFDAFSSADHGYHRAVDRRLRPGRGLLSAQRADSAHPPDHQFPRPLHHNTPDTAARHGAGRAHGGR